jgi:hypothetical protein
MSEKEIAEKAGISQQMVSSITAKVSITSLNLHFHRVKSGTQCCGWSNQCGKKAPVDQSTFGQRGPGEWYELNAQTMQFSRYAGESFPLNT